MTFADGKALKIAIVLRDDRGLELHDDRVYRCSLLLRSFFGTIEDWNNPAEIRRRENIRIAIVLRDDRGLEHAECSGCVRK